MPAPAGWRELALNQCFFFFFKDCCFCSVNGYYSSHLIPHLPAGSDFLSGVLPLKGCWIVAVIDCQPKCVQRCSLVILAVTRGVSCAVHPAGVWGVEGLVPLDSGSHDALGSECRG